ncbi:MAG: adaptor protein MecA [Clostridia bacterium]|nr:adaptor protein MecA [Clostridia bacterium]
MRYRVIDNKRLNVYLTRQDLQKENVSIQDIVNGTPESVVKIKKIFSVVSGIAEFDITSAGVNIVLMPIVDGDLLISACVSDECILTEKESELFVYDDFENLAYACLKAQDKCIVISSLYILTKKYYLSVKAKKCLESSYYDLVSVLYEFGEKSKYSELFIKEHGKNVIKNSAIETILEYFSK